MEKGKEISKAEMTTKQRMMLQQSTAEKSLKEILEDFQYKKAHKKTISVFVSDDGTAIETSVSALKKHDGNKIVIAHIIEMGGDYNMALQF